MANDHDKSLRVIMIFVIPILSFPFLLAHLIMAEFAFPFLGFIPVLISAFFGAVKLHLITPSIGGSRLISADLNYAQCVVMDFGLALSYLITLIVSWICLAQTWRNATSIVGTYATVPLMFNWIAHTYLAFYEPIQKIWRGIQHGMTCQNCAHCAGAAHDPVLEDAYAERQAFLSQSERASEAGGKSPSIESIV